MNHSDENPEFNFMKEKIKERPLNKKKLLRRTLVTASMAVVFGLVACLTFLLLEPLISNWLYPPEEPEIVRFPEETKEMLPEDMVIDDSSLENASSSEADDEEQSSQEEVRAEMQVEDYQHIYTKLYELAAESAKAIVTVTGVTSDVDWFDNPFENKGQTSGLIVANNGKEYLILVDKTTVETVEAIKITFCDGMQYDGNLKMKDTVTGLAVVSVDMKNIPEETKNAIAVATLGSSNATTVLGSAVIAIGSPLGTSGSISYGTITSMGNLLPLVDSSYKLLTTDIYGSQNASGVVLNLNGQVLGIIRQEYNHEDTKNLIAAVGISELKSLIEKMSNGISRAYVGIHGTNVTKEAYYDLNVPMGAYVTEIEVESPAMQAGIQSGDVIIEMKDAEIGSYTDYINALNKIQGGETITLQIMRQNKNEFTPLEITLTTATME